MVPSEEDDPGSSCSASGRPDGSSQDAAPPGSIDDSRVIQDVQAFREALQRGESPDRDALIAKYPSIAKELSACLDGLEFVQGVAPQFRNGGRDSARGTPPPPDEAFPPQALLGDYRIVQEIGRGGMGVVYEAVQVSLARRVALKVLPFAAVMDARQIGRFKNEALAAAQLDHPHIVNVHSVGCERGVHYYAMRYVDGRPLSMVIDELRQGAAGADRDATTDTVAMAALSTQVSHEGPAFFRKVAAIGREVADALDHAHRHGVVHRDVKPSNLLLDGEGKAWVTDFGLARMGPEAHLTMTGDLVGTLRYMSPEQLRGERAVVDHRTDIYSLGLTLYELLTQRPAFAGNDRQELLLQIATSDPPPPRRLNRAIPVDLETIVLKATAKDVRERYGTAQELADDLQRYLDDRPILARRASVLSRTRKWARRHKTGVRTAAAGLVFAVAMAAGSIGWVLRDRGAQRAEAEREQAARLAEADLAVGQALHEAGVNRDRGDWPQALETVQQTERLLAKEGTHASRQRVREVMTDLQMAARLEEITLSRCEPSSIFGAVSAYLDHQMSPVLARKQYSTAFRDYGIDIRALDAPAAAERIQKSSIRAYLVAALDDWIWGQRSIGLDGLNLELDVRRRMLEGRTRQAEHLRDIADLAAPDEWRGLTRTAALRGNRAEMEELARRPEIDELPASTTILLARCLDRAGAREDCVELLIAAQQREPDSLLVNFELAVLLWSRMPQERLDEAIGYMRTAVALRPNSPALHTSLAYMLGDAGHLDQGIASAQRSIDLNAPYGYAHRALATLCRRAQRWHAAIEALREESRLFPKNAAGRIELAWLLATCPDSELRNIDEALRRARTAIEQGTPIPANWWTVFGVASYRAGDWDGAIAALSETKPITHRGYTHAARFFLAMAHWNRGDRDQAHQWYADTINWMNGNTTWMQDHPVEKEELERFRAEAAALLALDTRAPEAKATADASTPTPKNDRLTAEEDLARAYLNLGKLLISRGDRAEALDRYAHALVILPNVLSLRRARVYTLAELGRWDEVREEFDRLAADRPDDLEVQFESAGALLAVGDSETYRRLCVDLLERINNKSSARSVYLAARIGAMGRDATDPLLTLELAVKGDQREPRRPYTLHTLALAQYRAGRWDEALRSVDASIAAMPTWSGHICNWLLLAIIHERIGHHDEARQWADKAAHWRQQAYGDIPAGAFPAPDMHVHDRWGCLLLQREVDDLLEAGSSDGENSSDQTIPPPDSTAKPAADAGAPGD